MSKKELLKSLVGKFVTLLVDERGICVGADLRQMASMSNFLLTGVGDDVFEVSRNEHKSYYSIAHVRVLHM